MRGCKQGKGILSGVRGGVVQGRDFSANQIGCRGRFRRACSWRKNLGGVGFFVSVW